jgi:transcriptional regulator with XRE-family HTH domain
MSEDLRLAAPAPHVPRRRRGNKARATELDVRVGQRLRDARLLAGVTQDQLGKAMGVSFQAVQKYESGENRLSVGRLARAATVLDQPVSYFFVNNEPTTADAASLTRQEAELLRNYRDIERGDIRETLLKLTREINELQTQKRG